MAVEVRCAAEGEGYRCDVTVSDGGSTSHHVVSVAASDLARWGKGRSVEELVVLPKDVVDEHCPGRLISKLGVGSLVIVKANPAG